MQYDPNAFTCSFHVFHIVLCTDFPHLPKASLYRFCLHLSNSFLTIFKNYFLIFFILQFIKFIKGQSLQLLTT